MKLLADECVDAAIVARLRSDGHDVLYIAEVAPGITDNAVLELANGEGRILLTADKDFGELTFRLRHTWRAASCSCDCQASLRRTKLKPSRWRLMSTATR